VAKKTTSLAGLGGLVYSTDSGRHCPDCSQPLGSCVCKQNLVPEGDGVARVRRESKGRGGKTVTTISGVPLPESELKELASALKRRCGTGGALKEASSRSRAIMSSCCSTNSANAASRPRSPAAECRCDSLTNFHLFAHIGCRSRIAFAGHICLRRNVQFFPGGFDACTTHT